MTIQVVIITCFILKYTLITTYKRKKRCKTTKKSLLGKTHDYNLPKSSGVPTKR